MPRQPRAMVPHKRVYRKRKAAAPKRVYRRKAAANQGVVTRNIAKAIGGAIGGYLGGPAGANLGIKFGDMGGSVISRITGSGDYKVRYNSLMGGGDVLSTKNDGVPVMHNDTGSVRVQHCEYIGNISSTAAFTNTSYVINPTNVLTFPWLSQIATNFEQWRPMGMVFYFKSMSSDTQISSTVSLGQVLLATEYNALANGFTSEAAMLNSQFSTSCKPSKDCTHYIECEKGLTPNQPLYCRDPNDSVGGDLRLYNLGNFQLATVGMQSPDGQTLGQLFVCYDIELLKPVLTAPSSTVLPYAAIGQTIGSGDCVTAHNLGVNEALYNFNSNFLFTPMYALGSGLVAFQADPTIQSNIGGVLFVITWVPNSSPWMTAPDFSSSVIGLENLTIDSHLQSPMRIATDTTELVAYYYCTVNDPTIPFGISWSGVVFTAASTVMINVTTYNPSM